MPIDNTMPATSKGKPVATEAQDPRYRDLDAWEAPAILDALLDNQAGALAAVRAALPVLEQVVDAALPRLARGGRLAYAGAGTSGRLAFQDGAELTPTFDWPRERLAFLVAGGEQALVRAVEGAEDRIDTAEADVAALALGPDDVLLALAASGTTPYTREAVRSARRAGCLTIGIANSPGAPLLEEAEIAVLVETGAEAIAGSTRLKAGTAQKIVLNLISTTLMIRLGRVWHGEMVDMQATNAKLRGRAERMLRSLTGADDDAIRSALAAADGRVKLAVLLLHGKSRPDAEADLVRHGNHLRKVLQA